MKFIALISVLIISSIELSQAGNYTGRVDSIITATMFDNKVYVQTLDEFHKTPKSCSTNKRYAFAFDGTTAIGKNFLMLLTSALTSGNEVYLQGDDNCKISKAGTVENLTTLQLKAK